MSAPRMKTGFDWKRTSWLSWFFLVHLASFAFGEHNHPCRFNPECLCSTGGNIFHMAVLGFGKLGKLSNFRNSTAARYWKTCFKSQLEKLGEVAKSPKSIPTFLTNRIQSLQDLATKELDEFEPFCFEHNWMPSLWVTQLKNLISSLSKQKSPWW